MAVAIARTAERVYDSFQPAQRAQARQLFLRLVEPGEGTDHARRKVKYAQLEGSSVDRHVIDRLVEARLLTAGSDGVEIAHEALIAAWPRLRSWIDDDRDGIRRHRHLTLAASAWDELGRDEGELYRGARLSAAQSWVGDAAPDLSDIERDFIDASAAVSETQSRQQMRANRRLRILTAASVVGVIVAAAGTLVAISKANDSDRRRAAAEAAQLVVTVRSHPDISTSAELQLAVAADHRASTAATQSLLLDAIEQNPRLVPRGDLGDVQLTGNSATSSNGGALLGIDNNALGVVLDTKTLTRRAQGFQLLVAVVDTGSRLLGVTSGQTLQTVDLKTRRAVGPPGVKAGPTQVALSPDGTTLAVANQPDQGPTQNGVSLYDVATGHQRLIMNSDSGGDIRDVTFSPDGRRVLAVADQSRAVVWDTGTGENVFASQSAAVNITRLAMSPFSRVIAVGRQDGTVEMWTSDDSGGWKPLKLSSSPHRNAISWIDFDSQGAHMVSTSRDGVAVVWDTSTGQPAVRQPRFRGSPNSVSFFRPGAASGIVTIDANGRILDWDVKTDGPLFTTVPGVNVGAPVSAATGNRVLVSSPTGVAEYNPSNGATHEVRFAASGTPVAGVAASADGRRFVVVYDDGRLELRDTASGDLLFDFGRRVHSADYNGSFAATRQTVITLDRRGTRVAYQDADKQIEVVDDKGTTVDTIDLSLQRRDLQALGLNDDGSELIVSTTSGEALWYDERGIDAKPVASQGTGFDAQFVSHQRIAIIGGGGAQIIDPRSRETTKLLDVGNDVTRLAVDGTSRLLATADTTGSIQLWDADTARQIGDALHIRNLPSAAPMRFSADGHYLLVSEPDETTWINVRTADWPGIACGLVTEQLSPTERALGSLDKSGPCP